MSQTQVDAALQQLRERGERITPGRRAVLEVLDDAHGHLDAESVATKVAERAPGVHRATVYRSLQALAELGIVTHTHVPGGATIYHLTPAAQHQHAHLQCTRCQRFFDLPVEELAALGESVRRRTGFAIDPCHAALLCWCADCADSEKLPRA